MLVNKKKKMNLSLPYQPFHNNKMSFYFQKKKLLFTQGEFMKYIKYIDINYHF